VGKGGGGGAGGGGDAGRYRPFVIAVFGYRRSRPFTFPATRVRNGRFQKRRILNAQYDTVTVT